MAFYRFVGAFAALPVLIPASILLLGCSANAEDETAQNSAQDSAIAAASSGQDPAVDADSAAETGAADEAAASGAAAAGTSELSPSETTAAFKAAGFTQVGGMWKACDDPGTPSYSPGELSLPGDLNGDGRPEALIMEGGTFCYGGAGAGYFLLSKQADGNWKLMDNTIGFANFLETTGADGWPDIEVGGPGFCFPVRRWNGSSYQPHRRQYQGQPC